MKYKQWNQVASDPAAVAALERAGLPTLAAMTLCARGMDTPEKARAFLDAGRGQLQDPLLMKDMDRAAARLARALAAGETIAVYGDYDVDGITSTSLLTDFLRREGGDVIPYIPDRMEEGYGLNTDALDTLHQAGVSLVVTVDCGITAVEEARHAARLGMDLVITDHHECKEELPAALAVVDPHQADCPYPFKCLAGVGVALKLVLALGGKPRQEELLNRYADLAAIGTVADVMSLTGENRTIVRLGLEALRHTGRPGLKALLRQAGLEERPLNSVAIGYTLAPRLNASGRMGCASLAAELLLTADPAQGEELAIQLCELNRERQTIEAQISAECQELAEALPPEERYALVLAGDHWHQGVVGIVASRLAEKYSCPAFMICLQDGKGKGSCRSFGGFNLFAALEHCAPLLEGFGGHELAAGFTILEENIPAFTAAMNDYVRQCTGGAEMVSTLDVDCPVDDVGILTLEGVEGLDLLEPYGSGNPKPVFLLRSVCVLSHTDVGGGRHLKLKLRRDGVVMDAIFFSANTAACGIENGQRLDIAFTLQINQFRGNRTVQLQLCDLRPAPTRSQLERSLFRRLQAGETLSPWEASLMLPQRRDFAHLWRYLEQLCAAGPAQAPMDQLLRQVTRSFSGHRSYGKALVCLHVMDERGLIQVAVQNQQATVRLCRPREKVDLEQAGMMRQLRHDLG